MLQEIYFLALPLICLCSKVFDQYNQKGMILSKYCPSIEGCQDGTHVMCLHYRQNNSMGLTCVDPVPLSITPEFLKLILDVCNRIRSLTANGKIKSEYGLVFPKGYGIYKLSWDPELAFLAQVWANECIFKLDFCRATKRFSNVGQIVGLSRDKAYWKSFSLTDTNVFTSKTIPTEIIEEAITKILRSWYNSKNEVTFEMLDYLDVNSYMEHNQFLQIVSGRSTHMGCGINAYMGYVYNNENAASYYPTIQLVCNFSYRPRVGETVYTMNPSKESGYSPKCGCPPGYDEDEYCLCYETDKKIPHKCKGDGCKPSVVVLPIFTVEDAPISQNNISRIIDTSAVPRHELQKRKPRIDYTRSHKNDVQILKHDSVYKTRRISTDVKNRYFGNKSKNINNINQLKTKPPHVEKRSKNIHKQSIFAKAAVFELPSSRVKQVVHNESYKKDVTPRRDFSKVQKLVTKYLEGRRFGHQFHNTKDNYDSTIIESITETPYSSPNSVTNKVYNLNKFIRHKFTYMDLNSTRTPSPKHEIKFLYEDNDQILMNLLDKLEEEVNNIDFNKKEKEIFDKKIRKIYGTLVKKSVVTEHSLFNGNISKNNKILDNNYDIQNDANLRNYLIDPNQPYKYSYPKLEERQINENSIKKYNNKIDKDLENNKYTKNDKKISYIESSYNENFGERELRNIHPRKKSYSNSMLKVKDFSHDNYYLNSDKDEYNSLDSPRRRNYHDKLNNLQRKLSMMKKHGQQNYVSEDRHLRPVRPSKMRIHPIHENIRHSRPKDIELYMTNRARFVHGF